MPLNSVDPSQLQSAITVSVDAATLVGKNNAEFLSAAVMPECIVNLSKARSVAYVIDSQFSREKLSTILRRVLIQNGFSPMPISERGVILSREIKHAARRHADYFLIVSVKTSSRRVGDYDLFKVQLTSSLTLYALPDGEPVFDAEGPSSKAVGASLSSAKRNAFAKIIPTLSKILDARMAGVK